MEILNMVGTAIIITLILTLTIGLIFIIFSNLEIGITMIFIGTLFMGILYHVKKGEKISEYSTLNYSYSFKQLEAEPEEYPGAKCVVKIENSEKENSSQTNNTKEKESSYIYDNKFYISKDCNEFKTELQKSVTEINDKIEKLKIDKFIKEEK